MSKRLTGKNRILEAVHETARGLRNLGVIDVRRMRDYDALCLPRVPEYSPRRIRTMRSRYNISQAVMAAMLNASLSTVRQWEIGRKKPSGPAAKLLNVLDRKGLDALS